MNVTMTEIHRAVNKCQRCSDILDEGRILPRSGFPPEGPYKAMIIGCEPGQSAEGRLSVEEYKRRFDWRTEKRNTVRLLFKAIHQAGVDWDCLFYTNAVKCPATPAEASQCYSNCEEFLKKQVQALKPRVILAFGRAANMIGATKVRRDEIGHCILMGYPCISTNHPQGATREYLAEVGRNLRRELK